MDPLPLPLGGEARWGCSPASGDARLHLASPSQPLPAGEGLVSFAGYAAIFDRVDRGNDVVRPGAFAASLARGAPVPLLWQHDPARVIGTVAMLAEDKRGLRVVGRVEPRIGALVAAGAVTGLSFGYRVQTAAGSNPRELIAVELVEVSLVKRPMQPLARVIAVGV